MMNELLSQLQDIAISALSMAIVGAILMGWTAVKAYIAAKIEQVQAETQDDRLKKILAGVKEICEDVSSSYDPVVEALKKSSCDGKLTADEIASIQTQVRDSSYSIIKELFTLDTLEKLGITEETIKEIIATYIEASVQKRKAAKPNPSTGRN